MRSTIVLILAAVAAYPGARLGFTRAWFGAALRLGLGSERWRNEIENWREDIQDHPGLQSPRWFGGERW